MEQTTQQRAAPRGDPGYDSAFVALYQSYYTKVFAFVYSRVGNVELSKDLAAEIFERAYVNGRGVRDQGAYGSWLFAIAKNVVMGHYRRQKRESNGMGRLKDSLWVAEQPADPEARAVRADQLSCLIRRLKELPQRDQELLSLKFDAELTYAEIGGVLGMTEVNARVSVFRALKRLRDRVAGGA